MTRRQTVTSPLRPVAALQLRLPVLLARTDAVRLPVHLLQIMMSNLEQKLMKLQENMRPSR